MTVTAFLHAHLWIAFALSWFVAFVLGCATGIAHTLDDPDVVFVAPPRATASWRVRRRLRANRADLRAALERRP